MNTASSVIGSKSVKWLKSGNWWKTMIAIVETDSLLLTSSWFSLKNIWVKKHPFSPENENTPSIFSFRTPWPVSHHHRSLWVKTPWLHPSLASHYSTYGLPSVLCHLGILLFLIDTQESCCSSIFCQSQLIKDFHHCAFQRCQWPPHQCLSERSIIRAFPGNIIRWWFCSLITNPF